MADTKNVFISHVHKDDNGLQKLKDSLAPKGMDVRDLCLLYFLYSVLS